MIKRLIDIIASAFGLVILSPILIVAAIAVKLGSPGPVFFRQIRTGKDLRPFLIFKFRTMVNRAPRLGGPITASGDPRITKIGRMLRATKLDEIPQLLNVLAGDMSLVGPRPEDPRFVRLFKSEYRELLRGRPGITDPASLKYRNESDLLAHSRHPEREYVRRILPAKLRISLAYARRATTISDLAIIFRTILAVTR